MTPAAVGDIEWHAVVDLFDYWMDHPPVHELVAAYLGVKPRNRLTADEIRSTAPDGCLSIDELRRVVAANPIPA